MPGEAESGGFPQHLGSELDLWHGQPVERDRRQPARQLRQPEGLVVGRRRRRQARQPDLIGAEQGDLDPAVQQGSRRPRELQARELEPDALGVRNRQLGQMHIERHPARQARDLDSGLRAREPAREGRRERPLAGGGLREDESGADQEQDKAQRAA